MTASSGSPRPGPYRHFKFRLQADGRTVAGFNIARQLPRAGGGPGPRFEAITLERGVTHDPEFEKWASRWTSSSPRRRDFSLEVFDEAGQHVASHHLPGCRVAAYQALPELDANANAIVIQRLRLVAA